MVTYFVASKQLCIPFSCLQPCLRLDFKITDIISCRSCLCATTPPLCPLCRKQYQPAKIKKLHVDRPENVDEAREAELGKQQLELLEQLVEIWDLELREGLGSDFNEESRDHSAVSRIQPEDGDDRSDTEEDVHGGVPAVPNSGVMGTDGQIGGLLGLRGEENFPFDHGNDVEQILDGIAGAPGIGRGFLERWGSTLVTHGHEEGPIVTVREAQKVHAAEVLRRVDVWLEDKDEDSVNQILFLSFFPNSQYLFFLTRM